METTFREKWLGRKDSNPRMAGPEPAALPLGDCPAQAGNLCAGWAGRIRTPGWRDQNPLPYRLATAQRINKHDYKLLAERQGFEPWVGF